MARDIHAFLRELYERLDAIDDAIAALEAISRRRGVSRLTSITADFEAESTKTGREEPAMIETPRAPRDY